MMHPLSCDNLTHSYGKPGALETALSDVSVEFATGKICLLMGPSGSGKTTLLSICGCLLRPTSGALLGSAAFVVASRASERTPLPLEMTWQVYLAVLGVSTLANLAGALLSVKAVLRVDPVAVFRG